jgi:hypothetical protein
MSTLVFAHVLFGLIGIAGGLIAVAGLFYRKRMAICNAVFLSATAVPCATGFAFLPIDGVTSAQLVSFFLTFLLAVAAYARYVRRLAAGWNQVYAFAMVGGLFLNILIATAQSFLHIRALKLLAPTQDSPVYVAVKFSLLLVFIGIAVVVTRRAGTSQDAFPRR